MHPADRYPRPMPRRPEDHAFTVSELTSLIKGTLEEGFPEVLVEGEVSNCRPSGAGHLYFSLKDREAVLSAVMFRNRYQGLTFRVADGMLVRAHGAVSVYAPRGSYQLVCDRLQAAGEGDLLAMLEERKRRLAAEGLFDEARKRPLPLLPSRIAVVTSPTGAAVRDILRVLKRRAAGVDIVVLPTLVQGEGADTSIAAQIEAANHWGLGDVLIVGRGGGSIEDLLPFSSEIVVRAIAGSRIPVISAVGHETDWTLSDLAADVRAPTPSAAAEIVSAAREDLLGKVASLAGSMHDSLGRRLERARLLLERFTADGLLRQIETFLQPLLMRADEARASLGDGIRQLARDARHRVELASRDIASCSPLAVLDRGYAVVTRERSRAALRSVEGLSGGDRLRIRLSRGALSAEVKETHADEKL
jgi:exodeoxyribonuclease VII large subunit